MNCPSRFVLVVWHCHHRLWTLLLTDLITENSYRAHICTSYQYIHMKYSILPIYFNGSQSSCFLYLLLLPIWLTIEVSYLAQICTFTGPKRTKELDLYNMYCQICGSIFQLVACRISLFI